MTKDDLNLLSKDDICRLLSISKRGLGDMVAQKRFPPSIRLGKSCYWSQEALQAWRQRACEKQANWSPTNTSGSTKR